MNTSAPINVQSPGFRLWVAAMVVLAGATAAVAWFAPMSRERAAEWVVESIADGKPLTQRDIDAKLGDPSKAAFPGWDAAYLIRDRARFLSLEMEWLVVRIDRGSGRITEARTRTEMIDP